MKFILLILFQIDKRALFAKNTSLVKYIANSVDPDQAALEGAV